MPSSAAWSGSNGRSCPRWASAVGVCRFGRDFGYARGAPLAGFAADAFGMAAAMWIVAALKLLSGVIVAVRMSDTPQ